jgi:hypothetical protein
MFCDWRRSKANGIQPEASHETQIIPDPFEVMKGIDNTDAF